MAIKDLMVGMAGVPVPPLSRSRLPTKSQPEPVRMQQIVHHNHNINNRNGLKFVPFTTLVIFPTLREQRISGINGST